MINKVFVGDIVNPKSGKTLKQENLEIQHKIPLDTLVEVNIPENDAHGIRLFVVDHTRDCDGEPLYSLSFEKAEHFTPSDTKGWSREVIDIVRHFERLDRLKMNHGYDESSLIIIREP